MDILGKYLEELGRDTLLDEFTVRDVQMKLPGIKHKWAGRLIRAKCELGRMSRKRKQMVDEAAQGLIKDSHIKVGTPVARKRVEDHKIIRDVDVEIEFQKAIIEFLEKAERIINSMTFDIKNLTEIMKLELH